MAQRKTDRKNLQGEETRIRLLEETKRLVTIHGYAGTNLSMVRRACKLSASSVYWHYSNKDELIAASLENAYRIQARSLPNWLDTPPTDSRVEDLYVQLMRSPNDEADMGYWRIGLQLALIRPLEPIPARDRFLQIRVEAVEWMADWWERTLAEDLPQRRYVARLMGSFTVALRESSFLKLRGPRTADTMSLTKLIASSLDAVALQLAELAVAGSLADGTIRGSSPVPASRAEAASGRDNILHATQEIIRETGYDGVSITKVCERAGLPASSLYWYFRNKNELLSTVISDACAGWKLLRGNEFALPLGGNSAEQIRSFILPSLNSSIYGNGSIPISLLLILQRVEQVQSGRIQLDEALQDTFHATVQWFSALLGPNSAAERPNAQELTVCLFRMLDGMLISSAVEEQRTDPQLLAALISNAISQAAQGAPSDLNIIQKTEASRRFG